MAAPLWESAGGPPRGGAVAGRQRRVGCPAARRLGHPSLCRGGGRPPRGGAVAGRQRQVGRPADPRRALSQGDFHLQRRPSRRGQPSRSWWRAASPTTPSARSAPAGSILVLAPPPSPTSSPPARAQGAHCGQARPTPVRPCAGSSATPWDPGRRLDTFCSTLGFAPTSGWCYCPGTGLGTGAMSRQSCGRRSAASSSGRIGRRRSVSLFLCVCCPGHRDNGLSPPVVLHLPTAVAAAAIHASFA